MAFSNRTGNELFRLLVQRAEEQLSELSDFDRYSAMLGAAIISVAEVLRGPAERGKDLDALIDFTSRWLRVFLEQAKDMGKGPSVSG